MHYLGKGSLYFPIRGSGYLESRFELYFTWWTLPLFSDCGISLCARTTPAWGRTSAQWCDSSPLSLRPEWSILIGRGYWKTVLWLVGTLVLFRHFSNGINNQLKGPKVPHLGHFLTFAGSLWHKDRWLPSRERIYYSRWCHQYNNPTYNRFFLFMSTYHCVFMSISDLCSEPLCLWLSPGLLICWLGFCSPQV